MYYTNKREINSAPKIIARLYSTMTLENLKGEKRLDYQYMPTIMILAVEKGVTF